MTRLDECLARARATLNEAGFPARDADILLRHALGVTRAFVYAHPEHRLSPSETDRVETLVLRRRAGEPVAYLVGHREFFSRELRVSPAVLVPRPETEHLVDWIVESLPAFGGRYHHRE